MHYEVDTTALHGEAQALTKASEIARQVSVEGPLVTLRKAVPSGSTAAAVGGVASAWRVSLADARLGVGSLAASVETTAVAYDRVEASATAALDAVS